MDYVTISALIVLSLLSYETSAQENVMDQCSQGGEKLCSKVEEGYENGVYTEGGNKEFVESHGVYKDNKNSNNRNNTGHMKPFGQSGTQTSIRETSGFPETNFFLEYFFPSIPVLMKGAALQFPAFHKWTTDDYMMSVASQRENKKGFVRIEKRKKERRGDENLDKSFYDFLKSYNDSDVYLVTPVVDFIKPFLMMPCPLQCPELSKARVQPVLWMSSGGTKSVVHTDPLDNINCVYRGTKTAYLLDPLSISVGTILDFPLTEGYYSLLDVERVDLNRYPTLRGAKFVVAHMKPGDCIYIPKGWVHQIVSFGSNVAANVWFLHGATKEVLKKGYCSSHNLPCDPTFTLGRISYPKKPEKEDPDDNEADYFRLFFEYCSVRGEAAVSPDNPPMTEADQKVKVKEFIKEIEKFQFHPFRQEKDYDEMHELGKEMAEKLKEYEAAREKNLRTYLGIIQAFDNDNDGILTSSELNSAIDEMVEFVVEMVKELKEMKTSLFSSENDAPDDVGAIHGTDDVGSDEVEE